jgi:hypothetical protein
MKMIKLSVFGKNRLSGISSVGHSNISFVSGTLSVGHPNISVVSGILSVGYPSFYIVSCGYPTRTHTRGNSVAHVWAKVN